MNYAKFTAVMAGSIALKKVPRKRKTRPLSEITELEKVMASTVTMDGGAVIINATLAVIILRVRSAEVTQLRKKKTCDMIKLLRRIKRLTPSTRATAADFLTGLRQTHQ